jgi:hypothetical protein
VSFLELPWLIVSLFLRERFDRDDGPDETPTGWCNVVCVLSLLLLIALVSLQVVDLVRGRDALQDCVAGGHLNCFPTTSLAPSAQVAQPFAPRWGGTPFA